MNAATTWIARLVGATFLGWTAGIHIHLYRSGYRGIPKIGVLFLLNGIVGLILCLAVLLTPRRLLGLVALAAAAFELGTILGLVKAIHGGIFGFTESAHAPYVTQALVVESVGAIVLGALAFALAFATLNHRRTATVLEG